MKKIICLFLILTLVPFGVAAFDEEPIIYPTDIRAFVDSKPINSFNINGWTGIVAEDLSAYGFTVIWDAERRTLEVGDRDFLYPGSVSYPQLSEYKVYPTDIKTYVNGNEVTAFNIGGYTVIFIDELMCYGDVIWDPDARTISFTYKEPWSINLTGPNHVNSNDCNPKLTVLDARFHKNSDGTFVAEGEGLEHLSWVRLSNEKRLGGMRIGIGMIARHLLSDESFVSFMSCVVNTNYDGQKINDDTQTINSHADVIINGKEVKIKEVVAEKGNNHRDYFFVLDCDMQLDDIESVELKIQP